MTAKDPNIGQKTPKPITNLASLSPKTTQRFQTLGRFLPRKTKHNIIHKMTLKDKKQEGEEAKFQAKERADTYKGKQREWVVEVCKKRFVACAAL